MNSLVNWDTTLKVGDIVFSDYTKNELLYKIVTIERRFLEPHDVPASLWEDHPYYGHQVGDEYNPLVTIKVVANFSIQFDPSKKLRQTSKVLDGAYLKRVDYTYLQAYMKRLQSIMDELWP